MFSAGFDLKVMGAGGPDAIGMVKGGFLLAERMLTHPKPLVVAVTGHAIAMGAFLVLCGDYRVGGTGSYRIIANEVAIGLTMPQAGDRDLAPATESGAFQPSDDQRRALLAGQRRRSRLPRPCRPRRPGLDAAQGESGRASQLDQNAHAQTKMKTRDQALKAIRAAVEAEFGA